MSNLVVEIRADERWIPLSLEGDVDSEAEQSAREVLRVRGEDEPTREHLEHVTAVIAGLSRNVRSSTDEDAPLVGALALMPEAGPVPLAVATLRLAEPVESLDDAVGELVAPPDERYEDPVVDQIDTPLGNAARIAQRLVADTRVTEWHGYVWQLPDAERSLLLSVTFTDLVDAGRWTGAFDDLAHQIAVWIEE